MKTIPLRLILFLTVAFVGFVFVQIAFARQGHMDNALDLLRRARYELNEASRNKGGHRTEAVRLIDQAIEQVKEGIAVGEEHGAGP
jgi:hypothetical protein